MIAESPPPVSDVTTISTSLNASNASNNSGASLSSIPIRNNEVRTVMLCGVPIIALLMEGEERLCLAQISNTLLKQFSYNEIHNRRVALGIRCIQCTPVQLELLRRAGAMPVSSRRCGMITKREAERLCKSFLAETSPPKLPDNFAFDVYHQCAWGSKGSFVPSRYNSSRAKCIKCLYCNLFFSPNKFIFHSHRLPESKYVQPDAANFNSWRRHIKLYGNPPDDVLYAWEDVKAMFNGGSRKRNMVKCINSFSKQQQSKNSEGEFSKRQKRDSQSPELHTMHSITPTNLAEATSSTSPTLQSSYYPIVPFPNKAYPTLTSSINPASTMPQPYTKLFTAPPQTDFRQNFAEFMWPGKRPALDLPYNGLLWHRPMLDSPVNRITTDLCFAKEKEIPCLLKDDLNKEISLNNSSGKNCPQAANENSFQRHFSAFKPVSKFQSSGHLIQDIVSSSVAATPSSESDNNEANEEDNVDVDVIGTEDDDNNSVRIDSTQMSSTKDEQKQQLTSDVSSPSIKDLSPISDRSSIAERSNSE
ncbi:SKI family transcriptional corepressor 1-B-like protein, partial [Dinothrombium tinctorium]